MDSSITHAKYTGQDFIGPNAILALKIKLLKYTDIIVVFSLFVFVFVSWLLFFVFLCLTYFIFII